MSTKNKSMSAAQRTKRSTDKYKVHGFQHAKVWIHPDEAEQLRKMARKLPLTKHLWSTLE